MIWIGCVVVVIAYFFLYQGTVLTYLISFFVIGPLGISGVPSEWLWLRVLGVLAVIAACVAPFALPACAVVWLLRIFVPDRIVSILVEVVGSVWTV